MIDAASFGRVVHQVFPSFQAKIGGAVWSLLGCHAASMAFIGSALVFPDLRLILTVLAGVTYVIAVLTALAFASALRNGVDAVGNDIRTTFADNGQEMHLFLTQTATDSEAGSLLRKIYGEFLAGIRMLVGDIRQIGINIAVDTARVNRSISATTGKATRQREISHEVATASTQSSTAINEVSESAQSVADNTAGNLDMAKQSYAELMEASGKMQQISDAVGIFRKTVEELGASSTSILKVVSTINDIAEQTNLLSLNATIEAARAGEHGKGFAVVAEEVRELAKRVKPATAEISENVNTMIAIVEKTERGTNEIGTYTSETSEVVSRATANFDRMVQDFEQTNEQLIRIAATMKQLSATNNEISGKVEGIDLLCLEIAESMKESEASVDTLSNLTESMLEMVSKFRTGEGVFDRLIVWAQASWQRIQGELEDMHGKGVKVFDTGYREIADTYPKKYETSYTAIFHKRMQPIFDEAKREMDGVIYSIAVDRNGYSPTHHAQFSLPVSGDREKDLLYSRHMRMFNSNKAEKRRSSHTKPMLLQTYMRDTGEIINDLSLPLHVNGRHWGAFIIGFDPQSYERLKAVER